MDNKNENKSKQKPVIPVKESNTEELLKVLKKWNWGAFFLTFVWGLSNRVWWSLLMLLPIFPIQLILPFILGAKGNLSSWLKKKQADDLETFKSRQKKWNIAGGIVGAIIIIFLLLGGFQVGKNTYAFGKNLYVAYIMGSQTAQLGAGINIIHKKTKKYPKTMIEVINSQDEDVKKQIGELSEVPKDITGDYIRYCKDGNNYFFLYYTNLNFSGSEKKVVKYNTNPKEGEQPIVDITEEEIEKLNCVQK